MSRQKKQSLGHSALNDLVVTDDCVQFCGQSLNRLAEAVGHTPFFAYDSNRMTQRVEALRAALPKEVHLHYAMKANPMPAVVNHMAGLVDGLDVASGNELTVALASGTDPRTISFAGPGKREAELAAAIDAGITINMESSGEMETIARLAAEKGIRAPVAVRVNPDFQLKTSGMKMGGGPQQFGVDAEVVPEMLAQLAKLPLDFAGFHIYCGSQNLRAEAICEAQAKTLELALELAAHAPCTPRILNIGGGFGIPYFPGETPLDLEPIGEQLARLVPGVMTAMPGVELVIELGRYLVGEAGIYVCQVIDRKVSRGSVFLVTDGGLHHHLAASGNFGQVIRKNYPVVIGNKVTGSARETASVVGPLCTPLDLLADRMDLAEAQPGDLVVVLQSGAYGPTASPSAFLSHPPAGEYFA
ncbi:MAG: pyridoxal-dependent decarboxylase, exosortase A system-associated [Pseudomonadota bacterium]